jgi:hypothetical protein
MYGSRSTSVESKWYAAGSFTYTRIVSCLAGQRRLVLVEEALAPEDLVEQQLAVVRLAVVDVEVQRPLAREQPVRVLEAGREKLEVVIEAIAVARLREQPRRVAPALKARALAVLIALGAQRPARLHLARVERRIHVHELEGLGGERRQQPQVVAEQDPVDPGMIDPRMVAPGVAGPGGFARIAHPESVRSRADGAHELDPLIAASAQRAPARWRGHAQRALRGRSGGR